MRLNLEQISEEFQNAVANTVFDLLLKLLMRAINGAAETMKKRYVARNRITENKREKSWFDAEEKGIRALRYFRIVQFVEAFERYK